MSQLEVAAALKELLHGRLRPSEALHMAEQAGYRSFADLCEATLPEQLPHMSLERATIRQRIATAIPGELPLEELRVWAEEVAAVLDRHELGVNLGERRRLSEALALVAVASDTRIFKNVAPVKKVLASIVRLLGRPQSGTLANLYGALFHQQPELHLLTRRLTDMIEDDPQESGPPTYLPPAPSFSASLGLESLELDMGLDASWLPERLETDTPEDSTSIASEGLRCADVVALNRPFVPNSHAQDYEWVVAFSVATRSLVDEDGGPSGRVEGFRERLLTLAPNFDVSRYDPEARLDQDGVLELVLRAETIGRSELVYATKLFALVHQIGRVHFEGRRLATLSPSV